MLSLKLIREFAILATAALCVGCWGMAYTVPTDAMLPNITREDVCIVNQFAYSAAEIERFDIVLFEMPDSEKGRVNATGDVKHIKRVVGLPGEKIEVREDKLYINNELMTEPFEIIVASSDRKRNFGPITIPGEEYFLLGDNRPESLDSRYFDHPTIRKTDIHGKVVEIKKGYYTKK